ncbi:D-alanyl-D-alanine carboxypeptidase/D-alanyl-D-alanine-endopeptidase [Streptomyces sp. NPDC046860]|uniref:D-alanyl-D-alanine carboxypeptidase/D-alanyl-D-alanine endopeptidase n=1 Tax=Streptomyces sp. NPDC046860 TaxID=3154495 RepID=UPI0033EA6DAF
MRKGLVVVPELGPLRSVGPRVKRLTDALRPSLAHAAAVVKPRLARLTDAGRPGPGRSGPRPLRTWYFTASAATAGLALAVGAVAVAGPFDGAGQRTAERDRAAALTLARGADHDGGRGTSGVRAVPSAPPVLRELGGAAEPVKSGKIPPSGIAGVLDPLLADPALGSGQAAAVVDVATGARVYGARSGQAFTPASTTKIATAVAALSALGPDHRLSTRTAFEPDTGELVLVGGGDPTLTAHKASGGWASLRTLAAGTAAALHERGVEKVKLSYDTTLYSGPALHPIGVNDNLAVVSALTADEGRADDSDSGPAARVADPAAEAARSFAGFLKDAGITTTPPGPSKATGRATTLAAVSSPPLSDVVERMLTNSDNDIAEGLARQTALASGQPGSFAGGAKAIGNRLTKLGLPMRGASFHDGSGLNREDRLTADLLTSLLATAADPARPGLRPVLTGLPVGGFTGTLAERYADGGAAGIIRAKTGTLTGVNSLAGTVVTKDGRLLAFAFLASGTTDPQSAQSALDHTATTLADCGCA